MAHRSASNHLMGTQTYWKRSTLWLLLSAHATRHQTPLEVPSLNDWRKVLMQCWVWESPILEWKWCRPSPRIMPLASWPLGIGCGHFGIKLFNEMHPMPRKLWDCQGVFWPACPISLPPMPLSADPSWEITPNPNFLRRPPVCYSCPENPSICLQHKHTCWIM